jgi:hypothetical protein
MIKDKYISIFYIIFSLFILLHLFLILNQRIFPFVDNPLHLSEATILRYYDEPDNQFKEFYTIENKLAPNTFHLYFCSLKIFPSVEFANKFLYGLYIILLPISMFLIIKKLGGNLWYSLLSLLLLYNYNVIWGFVGFTLSIPMVFIFLLFSIKYFESRIWHTGIILMSILILLFFIHIIAAMFCIAIFTIFGIYYNRLSISQQFKNLLIILPLLSLIVVWWLTTGEQTGPSTFNYLFNYYSKDYLSSFFERKRIFYFDNYYLFGGRQGVFAGVSFNLIIAFPLLINLLEQKGNNLKKLINRNPIIFIFFTFTFFCILILPAELPLHWSIYERFSVILMLAIILLGSINSSKPIRKFMIIYMSISLAIHYLLWMNYFIDFQKENSGFNKDFFPEKSDNITLSGIIQEPFYRGNLAYIHFPDYYLIWRKGIVPTVTVDSRFGIIKKRKNIIELPKYNEFISLLKNYDSRYSNMNYLIIRGNLPDTLKKYYPNFKFNKQIENWRLYEKFN